MDKVHYQSIGVAALTGVALHMGAKQSTGIALGGAVASYFIADRLFIESRDSSKVNLHSKEPDHLRR